MYFSVEALSNPTPVYQWRRVYDNGTETNLPSADDGNQSNLTLSDIGVADFGTYSVEASNMYGRWTDVTFELAPESKY